MALPILSLDAIRMLLRFEAVDKVRFTSGTGGSASPSNVLLREDGPCAEPVVRTEFDRCGNSVVDELVLDVPISDNRAPCLDGGGGGGDFRLVAVVALLATSPGIVTSRECCDDNVREELLRDRVSAEDCRSWLCLRARGTGGGALFWVCKEFDRLSGSASLSVGGCMLSRELL
jgi:hypothetical protein